MTTKIKTSEATATSTAVESSSAASATTAGTSTAASSSTPRLLAPLKETPVAPRPSQTKMPLQKFVRPIMRFCRFAARIIVGLIIVEFMAGLVPELRTTIFPNFYTVIDFMAEFVNALFEALAQFLR